MSYHCHTHVIWTTYMTWPPGDPRGHWSPLFDFYGSLIEKGHQLNLPDPVTLSRATSLASEPPRVFDDVDIAIVAETIGDVLTTHMRSRAKVFAGAIERTHVHLLLGKLDENIERFIGRLKGRTSSEVIARGSEPGRKRTWTAEYWKVFIFDDRVLPTVVNYIEQHNVRRGLPAAPFSWISPVY